MSSARRLKLQIAARLGLSLVVVPSIPTLLWWKSAAEDRASHARSVRTKVRTPNVQTVDDLLIEKIRAGDVLLFDRRCDRCAAGPLAALSCLVGRTFLCDGQSNESGARFDHCGVVVPAGNGRNDTAFLNHELLLLETTPGEGVVARPLLTRLEMSRSRSVLLLPLSCPGERPRRVNATGEDEVVDEADKVVRIRRHVGSCLAGYRDLAIKSSRATNYSRVHSLTCLSGAVMHALGVHNYSPSPVSPSAWLTVSALQASGVAANVDGRMALEARVEDFLRDHRFDEENVVRLRPGCKFLKPVSMRETSRSE